MASKMGNLKQYAIRELVTSTDFNNIFAEVSGDPIIGHEIVSGNRSDADLGDPSSGSTGHIIKDIYQREGKKIKILNSAGAIIKTLDLNDLDGKTYGILSGKSKTSGFPDFLEAGLTTKKFKILGNITSLEILIDTNLYQLISDLTSGDMALAPAANNTCLINDTGLTGQDYTKVLGEYGSEIIIDTIGSEITTLDGTIQCFKTGTEIFIAHVDTTGNKLIPIQRGIGGTDRIVLSNNDTITLLKGHYIFLDDNLTTIDTTENYPKWQHIAPVAPAVGDYYLNIGEKKWYRWSGSAWQALGRIFLGYAIADNTWIKWVEHEQYSLNWKNDNCIFNTEISNAEIKIHPIFKLNDNIFKSIQIINWSNLDTGGETASTWYYLYITNRGRFYLSVQSPRKYDERLGAYHPKEYWKCVDIFYNDSGSNLTQDKIRFLLEEKLSQEYFLKELPNFGKVPIGSIIAWHKSFAGVPSLSSEFLQCDGQVINDSSSPMNGQTLPDLNGDRRFLRGGSISGTLQAEDFKSHDHDQYAPDSILMDIQIGTAKNRLVGWNLDSDYQTDSRGGIETRPINMSAVWIMRIK